jgi:thymidylate synthase
LTIEERNRYGIEILGQSFLDEKEMNEKNVPRRKLNLLMFIRSNDIFLGAPFNITSYSLLIAMVAQCVNMIPGTLIYTMGDTHIYTNHIEQIKLQLTRESMELPKLWLNPNIKNIFDFKYDDIKLIDYKSHPTIKAEIAV